MLTRITREQTVDESREVSGLDADRAYDAHMRQLAAVAQAVDSRYANAEPIRDLLHAEQPFGSRNRVVTG